MVDFEEFNRFITAIQAGNRVESAVAMLASFDLRSVHFGSQGQLSLMFDTKNNSFSGGNSESEPRLLQSNAVQFGVVFSGVVSMSIEGWDSSSYESYEVSRRGSGELSASFRSPSSQANFTFREVAVCGVRSYRSF